MVVLWFPSWQENICLWFPSLGFCLWFPSWQGTLYFDGFRRWFLFDGFRLLQDRGCLSDGNRTKNTRTFPRRTKYIYIYIYIHIYVAGVCERNTDWAYYCNVTTCTELYYITIHKDFSTYGLEPSYPRGPTATRDVPYPHVHPVSLALKRVDFKRVEPNRSLFGDYMGVLTRKGNV